MKTLTVNRNKLVSAILAHSHASANPMTANYMVAVDHDDEHPEGRVIWCDTPSAMGGYFSNDVGEDNYDVLEFVENDSNDFTWGDCSEIRNDFGLAEDEEISDEIMSDHKDAARDFIDGCLLDTVTLDDVSYQVKYS